MKVQESVLHTKIGEITDLHIAAMDAARKRQAELAKPPGSLGRLEDLSIQLAGITGQVRNTLEHKELLVFCADNGIVEENVTQTGSEVTAISILSRIRLNTKLGLVSPALYPDHAVLIPELLDDLPFSVFATSSLDALIHAIESALSPKANEVTRMFSYQAIDMILRGYRTIAEQGKDARTPLLDDFLLASTYAGIAFGNAGCAAVHALSYPLGADRHVAHGESNYAIFSGVIRKYREIRTDGELAVLGAKIAAILDCTEESAFDALETLLENILSRKPLHEYGVSEADLVTYTESVLQNQTRLLSNNFVSLSREDILDIYQSLY